MMKEEREKGVERQEAVQGAMSGVTGGQERYLSIQEAARRVGVSSRSIYGYLESGKLPATLVDGLLMVEEEAVQHFRRRAPGRLRVRPPRWRKTPLMNQMMHTRITVRVRPGGSALLIQKLDEMQAQRKHCFPGTSARYIIQSKGDPDEIEITLFWRGAVEPSEEDREGALATLQMDLADAVEWTTARMVEGQVLLHA
jgi:excisionase family DNA binding protein